MNQQIENLVRQARENGIKLWVDGEKLRFRAPENEFPESFKQQLAANKRGIIEFLKQKDIKLQDVQAGQKPHYASSFAQERLWFIGKISDEAQHYNIPLFFKIKGKINRERLENAISIVTDRHEILRTSFEEVDGKLRQFIANQIDVDRVFSLIEAKNTKAPGEEINYVKQSLTNFSFDLSKPPLFKVTLACLDKDEYLLGLCFHHIIADDITITLFLNELANSYNAEALQASSSVRYVDYAIWQRQYLAANSQGLKNYWQDAIDTSEQLLDFPFDYKRKSSPSYSGGDFSMAWEFNHQEINFLKEKVRGSTNFIILLTAYVVFLYRYTGQKIITVGIPFSNRSHPSLQNIFGMFANSLPIQVELNEHLTFLGTLKQVKKKVLEAYQHGELPFEKIIESLSVERNAAHNPLFQTMFFNNASVEEPIKLEGCELVAENSSAQTAKFDFSISYSLADNKVKYEVEYSKDLLRTETVKRFTQHLVNLTADALHNHTKSISSLNLLSEAEVNWSIYDLNNNARSFNENIRVIELFENSAAQHPDAISVEYKDRCISYTELNRKANQVARYLKQNGVFPGKNVIVFMERSIDVVIAILGIMKSGGVFIPLDIEYPAVRIAHIIEDSKASIILTQANYLEKLSFTKQEKLLVDNEAFNQFESFDTNNLPHETDMKDLAYIIYTSGSTGKPKGVMIEQVGLAHYMMWAVEHYDCQKGSGCPVHSSLGFDLTITTIFAPLCTGKTVFMLAEELGVEGLLNALTKRQDYSLIKITPAHLKLFQELLPKEILQKLFGTVIIGGEALYADDLAFWREHSPKMRFINEYGATETSVADTIYEVGKELPTTTSIPVGKAIPNSSMFVLDKNLVPQPIGVIGEIYLGGNQIARGYLNRPELNATRFLPTPFPELIGDKIYKTGDLGKLLPDGNVVFVGRVDNQVKVNGYRIELGEIETCLEELEKVNQVICQIRHSEKYGKHIVAYVVPQVIESSFDASELKVYLRSKLPEYMMPKFFVILEELPLTINGKVNVKALPDPGLQKEIADEDMVAPVNHSESILCQVWANLFGLTDVGVTANFFHLGGDSIRSLQMIFEAKKLGLHIKPKNVFHYQTIRELAAVSELAVMALDVSCPTGELPLTPIQHWFFEQKLINLNHWNQAFILSSKAKITASQLQQALLKLAEHHDALRLRFFKKNGQWMQQYLDCIAEDDIVTETSLTESTPEQVKSAMEYAHGSLDIKAGKLFHTLILRDGKLTKILFVVHHLVVDGVSWRVIAEDINSLIKDVNLPKKTTSFGGWAMKLQDYAASIREETIDYWQEISCYQECWKLPFITKDFESSAMAITGKLTKKDSDKLFSQLHKSHIKLQEILLASLSMLLKPYATSERMLIDLEGHGREDLFSNIDLTRTLGWFTNTFPFPLRFDLTEIIDLLVYIRSSLEHVPDKGVSFGALSYLASSQEIRKSLAINPEVCFNYLGDFDAKEASDQAVALTFDYAGQCVGKVNQRPYKLNVNCYIINGALFFNFIGLLEQSYLNKLSEQFSNILKQMADALVQQVDIKPMLALSTNAKPEDVAIIFDQFGTRSSNVYPLTPMQEGMLYHTLYAPENNEYICQMCWETEENIERARVKNTWDKLAQRHETLRGVFCWENTSEIYQIILNEPNISFAEHRLDSEDAFEAYLEKDFLTAFDMGTDPAFRVAMLTYNNKSYMLWTFHHILLDGWSVSKLIAEFEYLYTQGEKSINAFKFEQYVSWLNEQPQRQGLRYWSSYLQKHQQSFSLTHLKKLNEQPAIYHDVAAQLGSYDLKALTSLAKEYGVTLNSLCLSALGAVLQRLHGSRDFIFGITVTGRSAPLTNIEHGIGNFLNTIPVAVQLTNVKDFEELAKNTQEDLVSHQEFEHISLAEIQKSWKQIGNSTDLFDMLYVFENYPVESSGNTDIKLSNLRVREYANYPLTFVVGASTEGLVLKLTYDMARVKESAAQGYLNVFQLILNELINDQFSFSTQQVMEPSHQSSIEKPRKRHLTNKLVVDDCIAEKVLALCGEVLGVKDIKLSDSFSSIGGTSLSAIRMVSKLRSIFEVDISIKAFSTCENLAELSNLLQSKLSSNVAENEFEEIVI